jgi:hypothetical protein
VRGVFFGLGIFLCVSRLCAQNAGLAGAGLLGEANGNTRKGCGAAAGLMADYNFTDNWAAGLRADYGNDFDAITSFEVLAFGRYYFLDTPLPFPLFVQAGAGLSRLSEKENKTMYTILGDGALGARFLVHGFYAEPYIRFGWPAGLGVGFALGYRFPVYTQGAPGEEPPLPPAWFEEKVYGMPEGDTDIPDIPRIIFRANHADFAGRDIDPARGLDEKTIENNYAALRIVAGFMKAHPSYALVIEGYANPVLKTIEEETRRLLPISRARSRFAADELIKLGVDPRRVIAVGSGGQDADPDDGRRNRRVRFHFYKTPGVP